MYSLPSAVRSIEPRPSTNMWACAWSFGWCSGWTRWRLSASSSAAEVATTSFMSQSFPSGDARCLPLTLAELAEIDRAAVVIGGAAEEHLALHLAVAHLPLEAIGDG